MKNLKKEENCKGDGSIFGWIIVFTSFFAQFVSEGVTLTFGVFLAEITKEFTNVGKGGISWIASIMNCAYHVAGPLASILVNKLGLAKVSIIGTIIGAAGFALSYFAKTVVPLYFSIGILAGGGLSLVYVPAMVSVAPYFKTQRSLAMGISVCGAGFGTLFFEWIVNFILRNTGWREAMLMTGGMILFVIPLSLLYSFPEYRKGSDEKIAGQDNIDANEIQSGKEKEVLSLSTKPQGQTNDRRKIFNFGLLKDKVFLLFALCDIFMGLGYSIPYLYLPEVEQSLSGIAKESSVLGIIGLTNIAGRAITGFLGDFKWFNRHIAYSCTLILCGLLTVASPFSPSLLWLRIYAGVYGTLLGSYMTLKSVNLVDILGLDKLTDAYGLLLLFQAVGFIVGPPVVGLFYDAYGSRDPGFYFAGIVITLGGVLLGFIPVVQRIVSKSEQNFMPVPVTEEKELGV